MAVGGVIALWYSIYRREVDAWRPVHRRSGHLELRSIAGWADTDIYAVGYPANDGPVVRWSHEWSSARVSDRFDLWNVVSVGPNDYFAVGCRTSGIEGIILRGRRP